MFRDKSYPNFNIDIVGIVFKHSYVIMIDMTFVSNCFGFLFFVSIFLFELYRYIYILKRKTFLNNPPLFFFLVITKYI